MTSRKGAAPDINVKIRDGPGRQPAHLLSRAL